MGLFGAEPVLPIWLFHSYPQFLQTLCPLRVVGFHLVLLLGHFPYDGPWFLKDGLNELLVWLWEMSV